MGISCIPTAKITPDGKCCGRAAVWGKGVVSEASPLSEDQPAPVCLKLGLQSLFLILLIHGEKITFPSTRGFLRTPTESSSRPSLDLAIFYHRPRELSFTIDGRHRISSPAPMTFIFHGTGVLPLSPTQRALYYTDSHARSISGPRILTTS
jgi:hypothetical protein